MEKNTVPTNSKTANPKQVVAIGVLSLLLVGVGIWQWRSLSGGTPEQKPSNAPKSGASTSSNTPMQIATNSGTAVVGGRAPFAPRDPFKPYYGQPREQGTKVVAQQKPSVNTSSKAFSGVPPLTLPAPGTLQLEPSKPEPEAPPMPQWGLTGVVQGPKSLAILKDGEGNRRFVKQGDVLEDGWRVHRIERGQIVLKKANQQISIRVGQSTQETSGGPKE